MNEKQVMDAYVRIRTIDNTIPDDVLDFMKDAAIQKLIQMNNSINQLNEIILGNDPQFYLNKGNGKVECRCGSTAVLWGNKGYLCGTITAYPCKYNK